MRLCQVENQIAAAFERQELGWIFRLGIPVSLALLLTVATQEAWAGACDKARLKKGCVTSGDVRTGSLTALDLSDEAGAHFALGRDKAVNGTARSYVSVTVSRPSASLKTAVVRWSANIGASAEPGSRDTVECTIDNSDFKSNDPFISGRFVSGSVDRRTRPLSSIGGTEHFSLRKSLRKKNKPDKITFRLLCRTFFKRIVSIQRPSIAVILYP